MQRTQPVGRLSLMWLRFMTIPLPVRLLVEGAVVPVTVGAVWGLIRGVHYLPTLPVAIIEGAIIVGVPGTIIGVVIAGIVEVMVRTIRGVRR